MKKLAVVVVVVVVVAALGAALWWAYRPTGRDAAAPLAFAPADTPYLFGNLEPLPQPVIDKALQQSAAMTGLYAQLLDELRGDLAASEDAEAKRMLAVFDALRAEFTGKTPQQVVAGLGIGLHSRMALYGIGTVPVLRIEVADPEALRGFIGRMESAAGEALPSARLDDLSYWTLRSDGTPLMGIAALIGKHLVLSLAPADADPTVLRTLLGLDRPRQSALDSGALEALNRDYGYLPYFSGYLDSAKLLAALQADSAVDRAFLAALDAKRPELSADCAGEFAALAAAWPRASVGYEVFEAERNVSRFVLEARPDIATALMKLRAPMPGLGAGSEGALINLGLSLKLDALPGVVGGFAGKVASAPWTCPELAPLNAAFAEAAKGVNTPALFAAAPVFSGLHLIIDTLEMDFSPGSSPGGTGVLLIGSANPASLVAMAKGLAPPLADLDLPSDGSVVALPALPGLPPGVAAHAASRGTVIGIGIGGEAIKERLPGLLAADPAQQPLFVMGIGSNFYVKIAEAMAASAEQASDGDAVAAARLKAQAELLRQLYSTLFLRIDSRVELSDKGIEFRQTLLQR
jgi:hypothetical protein